MLRYLYWYRLIKLMSSLANKQMATNLIGISFFYLANIQKIYFTLRCKPGLSSKTSKRTEEHLFLVLSPASMCDISFLNMKFVVEVLKEH